MLHNYQIVLFNYYYTNLHLLHTLTGSCCNTDGALLLSVIFVYDSYCCLCTELISIKYSVIIDTQCLQQQYTDLVTV